MTTEDDERPRLKPMPLLAPGETMGDQIYSMVAGDESAIFVQSDEVQEQRRIGWNLAVSHSVHAFEEGRVAERLRIVELVEFHRDDLAKLRGWEATVELLDVLLGEIEGGRT